MSQVFTEEQSSRSSPGQKQDLTRAERLLQLERIVTSSHFRNSKRYPSFLRFVVERTVEENSESLKERNLGIEIFGRPANYDTNADPIVRVTAGEVRKRIAQYYQTSGHEEELRIDLPLGSYVRTSTQHMPFRNRNMAPTMTLRRSLKHRRITPRRVRKRMWLFRKACARLPRS